MNTPAASVCPRCGGRLLPDAPKGLCPRCLAAMSLATETQVTDAGAAPAQAPLTPAELAPHFPQLEILECLGRGGMGVVYKARQKTLNRVVALKLLAPERVTDAGFAERFTREAQALARLNHPNIVTIHDFGCTRAGDFQSPPLSTLNSQPSTSSSGFYFLLMEFVDGVNLRQAMRAGRFTPEQALIIVPPVCEALHYAHEQGIVHRDIKPENLLLDKAGRVKIADFGIAKMLEHGRAELPLGHSTEAAQQRGPTSHESFAAGTPQYMAPEQKADPQHADHRADIYSLGVVLYEMLTGELPGKELQPPSRKVQIDVRLDEIVLRALEEKPELRYATAAEFRSQVETWSAPPAAGAGSASAQPHSFWPALLLLVMAVLIPLAGLLLHNRRVVAESAQRTAEIRQLQTQSVFLSQRLGEANAVVGRAASRAGNDAESEATRAQAREEQLTYQKRATDLQKELEEVHASLGRITAQPSRANPWVARIAILAGMLGVAGALLLLRSGSGPRRQPGPAAVVAATGIALLACVIAGVLLLAALRTGVLEALVVLGLVALVAWKWGPKSGLSPDVCLRVLAYAAFVLSLPVIALGLFFLVGLVSQSGRWNPGSEEAVVVPLLWLGMLLLPWAGMTLWHASRQDAPPKVPRPGFVGVLVGVLVVLAISGFAFVGTYLLSHSPARESARLASGPEIERVEVTTDQAVVHARGSDGAGMILLFGSGTNRWTPVNLYLEAMFDVTMEGKPFEPGVRWIIKLRRGIRWDYQLDDPAGQKKGKVTFHPGTPAPETDGSFVIGEFRPERGEPLPLAVLLKRDETSSLPGGTASPSTGTQPIELKVLRVEAPPGLRDIRVHFECAAPAGTGFEVGQDVTRGPYGETPKSKDAFWLRTKWVSLSDPPVLVWTLPEDFTPAEVQAGAKQVEAHLRTMRDALRMLPTEAVSSFGKVRHREGWLYELVLRVKLARDHSPVQAADAWVVEGTVRDGAGQPVPDADIHVSSGAGSLFVTGKGKTGADGAYRVGFGPGISMSAGDRRGAMQAAIVHVGKPGFAEKELGTGGNLQMAWELTPQQLAGGWQPGPQKTFLPGKPLRVDFVLLPAATVRGTLLTPDGQPVPNRSIVLVGDRLRPASSIYASAKTDAGGRFTFKDVSTQHAWSFSIEKTPHHRKRTTPDRFAEARVHEVTLIADGDDLRRGDAQTKREGGLGAGLPAAPRVATTEGKYDLASGVTLVITAKPPRGKGGRHYDGRLDWPKSATHPKGESFDVALSEGAPFAVGWRADGKVLWVACGGGDGTDNSIRYIRKLAITGPGDVDEQSWDAREKHDFGGLPPELRRVFDAFIAPATNAPPGK